MGSNIKDKWFHGTAPRQQVEDMVKKAGQNGSFAVRCSESVAGGFTLSLLHNGRVFTYRILPTSGGELAVQTSDGVQKQKFASIDDLINKYKTPGNGLVYALTNPIGKVDDAFRSKPALPRRNFPPRAHSAATLPLPPVPTLPYTRVQTTEVNPVGILAAVTVGGYQNVKTDSAPVVEPQNVAPPPLPPRPQIRQTVSSDSIPPPSNDSTGMAEETTQQTCVICFDSRVDAFFQPCGHICCCMVCSKKIRECPLCRKKISKTLKAYLP